MTRPAGGGRPGHFPRVLHPAIVVGSFTALSVWLFSRGILEGTLLAESDLYEYHLPIFRAPFTLWSDFEFAGFPAFADPQNATWYPVHLLFSRLLPSWTAYIVSAYVLGASFTYAYVFGMTRSRLGAAIGALGFAMGEGLLARTAHAAILHSIVWLPLALLSVDRIRETGRARWVAVGALGIAGSVLGGHPQFTVYSLYCVVLYALVGGVATRAGRRDFAAIAAMIAIGGLLSAIQLVPFAEASFETARTTVGFSQFVSSSITLSELLTIPVLPALPHEGREAPLYVGLGVLVLALVGASRWRHDWRLAFWLCVVVTAVLFGLGSVTPAGAVAFKIPLYDKFRLVVRHLYLAAFGASVLAGAGVLVLRSREGRRRVVIACIVVVALLGVAIYRHRDLVTTIETDVRLFLAFNRLPILGGAAWVQLSLMAATIAALLASWIPSAARVWPIALVAIAGVDVIQSQGEIDLRGLGRSLIREEELQPSVHARALAESAGLQRLVTLDGSATDALIPGSMPRLWRIPSAGAYNAMLLAGLRDVAQMGNNGAIRPDVLQGDDVGLDVLAIRYLIVRAPASPLVANPARWREHARVRTSRRTDRSVDRDEPGEEEYIVYENPRAQPRAWIAGEVVPLTRPDALRAIRTSRLPDGRQFAPSDTALVDPRSLPAITRFTSARAEARVERIEDGRVELVVETDAGGYLVLSDTFYPGWRATVDGVEVPVHRTDVALRGIVVPAGRHAVIFDFAPTSLYVGAALSAVGVLLVSGVLLHPRFSR